jgi:glycine/D-amino acid oxidase-like deaminating enzyme
MKTRYNRSPWIDGVPVARRAAYPKLRGEQAVDVVVIGGGLTGCVTAHACVAAGLRTVLLEADRLGQSSSGRSAGLLLAEPGPDVKELAAAHGLPAARYAFEAWQRGTRDAASLLRRLGIKCDLDIIAACTIASGGELPLKREFEARAAAGVPARWLRPAQAQAMTGLDAAGALRLPDGYALDPYRACLGVAAAAARRGALIFERSGASKVRALRTGVQVVAAGGTVRAATVVVATGVATTEFKPLRRHFKRRHTYQVLTEVLPPAMRRELGPRHGTFRDRQQPSHRVRWTGDRRILIGGADQDEPPARLRDAVIVQRTGQLMYELLTMYPSIAGLKPEYGWDLAYGDSADGLMYVGPHRNYPHHLFALGGRGDSITGAFVAAGVLARHLRGELAKGDEVFGWTR